MQNANGEIDLNAYVTIIRRRCISTDGGFKLGPWAHASPPVLS